MEKLFAIALLVLVLVLFGRETTEHKTVFSGIAMTMPYRITLRQKISPREQQKIDQTIRDIFWRTHVVYNKFNPHSELSYLNQLTQGRSYHPSPLLMALLKRVDSYVKVTQGLFDPTVENKEVIGWDRLRLEGTTITKGLSEICLDLGGVAKGTTIDELLQALLQMGYRSILVEWGGDFAFSSERAPWRIELFDPEGEGEILSLTEGGLATSGDYQQYWKEGDHTFFHLYHPKEHRYLEQKPGQLMSVSVLAPTAEEADLFATTLLLLETEEKASGYLSSLNRKDLRAWYVSHTH